jgi:hypothetical protein
MLIAARGRVAARRTSSPPPRCCPAPTFPLAVLVALTMSGKIPRIVMREAFGFHVLEEDWCEIEKRYAHSIPAEARSAVNDVTEKYLRLASAEQDAPSKADALKRLEDLKGRTASLKEAINELPADNPIREYVDEQIAFAYSISKYEDSTSILEYLSTFERELERFSKACRDTISFLLDYDFWPARAAWDIWIRQLTQALDRHGLPTSARKDSDKAKTGKASQFVELVDALQRLIPERFRRSIHSKPALATAIHKARKHPKRLKRQASAGGRVGAGGNAPRTR